MLIHAVTVLCYEVCEPCKRPIETTLPCNHTQPVSCHKTYGDLTEVDCMTNCPKTLPCGHACQSKYVCY